MIKVASPEPPWPRNKRPVSQEDTSEARKAVTGAKVGLPRSLLPTKVLAKPVEGGLLPCQLAAKAKSPELVWLKKRSWATAQSADRKISNPAIAKVKKVGLKKSLRGYGGVLSHRRI